VVTATGLDADQARLQVCEKLRDLVTPKLLAQHYLAALVTSLEVA
jgi:hypothetical protein